MLHLLLDGLRDISDYPLYKKKGVLPHLMLLHNSPFSDKKTKVGTRIKVYCFSNLVLLPSFLVSHPPTLTASLLLPKCCCGLGVEPWPVAMVTKHC